MMRPRGKVLFALWLTFCLSACRVLTPAPDPTVSEPPAEADPPPVTGLPNEIHWVRNSAEYRAGLIQAYRFAGEVLAATAVDLEPGTWAVALDADETLIDNSQYQKERALVGQPYDSESWAEWVGRRRAPPLPGAVAFLAQIRELGGKIAIVTNRKQAHCPDTQANFRAFEIPFDVILCKPPGVERKEGRWQQIEKGTASPELPPLDIVMWLGDNIRDFPELGQELRNSPESTFERFGIEFFVLPNPMYGSWRDNAAD